MLGVPSSPGVVGYLLLLLGALAAIVAIFALRRWLRATESMQTSAAIALIVCVAALPYVAWRFVEDLRVTTKLHGYDAAAAGPVQAYLPGYLVEGASRLIPRDATFATVVGPSIPWHAARLAFPALAMETLFPRVSVADPRHADYLVTWGMRPSAVAPVTQTWVARPRVGAYAAIYVGKVAR